MDLRRGNLEGWSIQMRGTTPEKIVCVRGYSRWNYGPKTDREADAFVRAKAEAGSAYHIEALVYVAFTEPQTTFIKSDGMFHLTHNSMPKFPLIQTS